MLNSSYAAALDYPSGHLLFNSTLFALRRCAIRDQDSADRAAALLADLWGAAAAAPARDAQVPRMRVKAHLGASLTYDSFWRYKLYIGQKEAHAAHAAPTPGGGNGPVLAPPVEAGGANGTAFSPDFVADNWEEFPDLSFDWNDDFYNSLPEFMS